MKKAILGFVAGIMAMSSVNVIASATKQITASYTVNDIIINEKNTGKGQSAFIFEGTTYVPLRLISEILGANVSWDSGKRNVRINFNNTTNTNTNTNNTSTNNNTSNSNQATASTNSSPNATTIYTQKYIGYDKARQIAVNKAGGGTVVSFSTQLNASTPKYGVEVLYGTKVYKYEINAKTGSIISSRYDDVKIELDNYDYDLIISKFISVSEAQQIAIKRTGGGQIISTTSFLEATVPEYEIEVLYGNSVYEVVVNAETGNVKSFRFVENYYDEINFNGNFDDFDEINIIN